MIFRTRPGQSHAGIIQDKRVSLPLVIEGQGRQ